MASSSVTIHDTGKYLDPFIRDLSKPHRWVRPVFDRDAGLFFDAKPSARTGEPPDGMPHLLLFPPMYHPVEISMMDRGGYGGVYPAYSLDAIRGVDLCRRTWDEFLARASRVLYWPKNTAAVIYHLCTPVRNENGGGPDVFPYRDRLWRALLGRGAPASFFFGWGNDPYPHFWGGTVKGEVEL